MAKCRQFFLAYPLKPKSFMDVFLSFPFSRCFLPRLFQNRLRGGIPPIRSPTSMCLTYNYPKLKHLHTLHKFRCQKAPKMCYYLIVPVLISQKLNIFIPLNFKTTAQITPFNHLHIIPSSWGGFQSLKLQKLWQGRVLDVVYG